MCHYGNSSTTPPRESARRLLLPPQGRIHRETHQPPHKALQIGLGFLQYAEECKAAGAERIFPHYQYINRSHYKHLSAALREPQRQLHLALTHQARGHHALGDIARRVRRRTVDLRKILALARATAGVDDDLAAAQAAVALRAADEETPGRVKQETGALEPPGPAGFGGFVAGVAEHQSLAQVDTCAFGHSLGDVERLLAMANHDGTATTVDVAVGGFAHDLNIIDVGVGGDLAAPGRCCTAFRRQPGRLDPAPEWRPGSRRKSSRRLCRDRLQRRIRK